MTSKTSDSATREVIREVPVDRGTAVKLRKIAAKADKDRYRAACKKSRSDARDSARELRFQARIELAKIKATTSATEKARSGIALASPWMVCFLVGGFVFALSTGAIPAEATATSSALITLVMTGLLANLRSIISESNGHGEDDENQAKKPKPKVKD